MDNNELIPLDKKMEEEISEILKKVENRVEKEYRSVFEGIKGRVDELKKGEEGISHLINPQGIDDVLRDVKKEIERFREGAVEEILQKIKGYWKRLAGIYEGKRKELVGAVDKLEAVIRGDGEKRVLNEIASLGKEYENLIPLSELKSRLPNDYWRYVKKLIDNGKLGIAEIPSSYFPEHRGMKGDVKVIFILPKLNPTHLNCLKALEEKEYTSKELAKNLGRKWKYLRRILYELRSNKLIDQKREGKKVLYSLTSYGDVLLKHYLK